MNANGELLDPKPVHSAVPVHDVAMDEPQRDILQRARAAEFAGTNRQEAIALYREFLETAPPPTVAQQARYSLALLYQADGFTERAVPLFHEVLDDPAPAFGDAGGDLKTLSMLKLALLNGSGFDHVCSNAVVNPSPLTAQTLRFIFQHGPREASEAAQLWWSAWQRDEMRRRLWDAMKPEFATYLAKTNSGEVKPLQRSGVAAINSVANAMADPRRIEPRSVQPADYFWIESVNTPELLKGLDGTVRPGPATPGGRVDDSQLVQPSPYLDGHRLHFWSAAALAHWADKRIRNLRAPQYFGVSVSIAGYNVTRPEDLPAVVASGGGKGAGRIWMETRRTNAPSILATASRSEGNAPALLAKVHLIGPDLLFEQQNARRLWFQLVIAARRSLPSSVSSPPIARSANNSGSRR